MRDPIKIALVQQKLIGRIPEDDFHRIKEEKPDFVCLPEYFFVPEESEGHRAEASRAEEHVAELRTWSRDWQTVLIGGSVVEKNGEAICNTCYVFDRGDLSGTYSKVNLFHGEVASGLSPGTEYRSFGVGGLTIGVLICADVLNPNSFVEMNRMGCDIVFVPTTSPYKAESVETKFNRDLELFVAGARRSRSYVAKCCAVGSIFGHPLQGRSLVASPEGILNRVEPSSESEACLMFEELTMSRLYQWRKEHDHHV